MSTGHNLEPQAYGCIRFKTTFGDLVVELFTKQCPKITKNFVQLCLDGYYNGTIFESVDKDFIAIGGKLSAGKGIVTDNQPDEFHSRLRLSRRGLLATANKSKDSNGPEFFFTLGPTPELQNKHSMFGRLRDNSVYCLVDLNECPVDADCRPLSEKKILETIIEENPYPNLKPRPEIVAKINALHETSNDSDDKQEHEAQPNLKYANKKLSFYRDDSDEDESDDDRGTKPVATKINKSDIKTRVESSRKIEIQGESREPSIEIANRDRSNINTTPIDSNEDAKQKRLREIKSEFQHLKKQFAMDSATKIRTLADRRRSQNQDSSIDTSTRSSSSKHSSVIDDPDAANVDIRLATKKGIQRERQTLELMENFKKKLKQTASIRDTSQTPRVSTLPADDIQLNADRNELEIAQALDLVDGDAWLRHKFDAKSDATSGRS